MNIPQNKVSLLRFIMHIISYKENYINIDNPQIKQRTGMDNPLKIVNRVLVALTGIFGSVPIKGRNSFHIRSIHSGTGAQPAPPPLFSVTRHCIVGDKVAWASRWILTSIEHWRSRTHGVIPPHPHESPQHDVQLSTWMSLPLPHRFQILASKYKSCCNAKFCC